MGNLSHFNSVCANSVNLSQFNVPYKALNITGRNTARDEQGYTLSSSNQTISLTANECFEYLWLNVLPVANMTYDHSYGIRKVTIKEMQNEFVLIGSGSLENNGEMIYNVNAAGLNIDESFVWNVTGNLEIIGSNQGKTVKVKATNSIYSGTITASLGDCGVYAQKMIDNCSSKPHTKNINGKCETARLTCISSIETGRSNQFGPIYITDFGYKYSDGTYDYSHSTESNMKCANSSNPQL